MAGQESMKKLCKKCILRVAATAFVQSAITERANLTAFHEKPTPRVLIGIFTIGDLLKAYKTMFGVGERGAAMISIVDDGDPRIMSKLIGIMEEKNVHCTRLLRKPATRRTKAMIYLRVNTYNTRAVQKAIEAAGYEIHVPYSAA